MNKENKKQTMTDIGLVTETEWSKDLIEHQVDINTIGVGSDIEKGFRTELEIDVQNKDSKLNKERKEKEFYNANPLDEYKLKHPMMYTNMDFINFKKRFGEKILKDGISTEDALKNPDIMNLITSYAKENFIDNASKNIEDRVTYKFSHLTINSAIASVTYPVVTVYRGHFMTHAIYFRKTTGFDGSIAIEPCTEPVVNPKIDIWTP